MAFKVNYNQQRMERDRAKVAKKEAKQRERDEEKARSKAERETGDAGETAAPEEPADGTP